VFEASPAENRGNKGGFGHIGAGSLADVLDSAARRAGRARPAAAEAPRRGRGLSAAEVCAAAAMADLAAVVCILLRFVPVGPLAAVVVAAPFAVVGERYRLRACVVAGLSGGAVGFLLGGLGCAGPVVASAGVGSVVGVAHRRGWGYPRTAAVAGAGLGVPAAAVMVGGLWMFGGYRELAFAQLASAWQGMARLMIAMGCPGLARFGGLAVGWALGHWAVLISIVIVCGAGIHVGVVRLLLSAPLRALERLLPADAFGVPLARAAGEHMAGHIAPLPVRLRKVAVRYPNSRHPAVSGVDLNLAAGEFVTVVGPNGAGKSTLGRVLAGMAPHAGEVLRPGAAGLGLPGGTGMVFQRPDSQVLGVRVVDDVLWGLPSATEIDVEALLERVGLSGLAERETATLSGGQLQRLAIAALLARRPSLIISDESTAMLDQGGRARMLALLRSLAAADGRAVLHITHRGEELPGSHRTVVLGASLDPMDRRDPATIRRPASSVGAPLHAHSLGFAYDPGTPWEHRVLDHVELDLPAGAGLLVTGANGSGKSTLAAILAGLATPTEGVALMDGRPVRNGPDAALLGLQHPRLQLVRSTVGEDVQDAANLEPRAADAALEALGLAPERYRDRRIDELSVGEQRRVALAGLLACQPRVLVLDEPLAWLDQSGRAALLDTLRTVRETGTTMVLTTHDTTGLDGLVDQAVLVADRRIRPVTRRRASAPTPTTSASRVPGTSEHQAATSDVSPRPTRRSRSLAGITPRTLPWSSPASRLWAGTKLAVLCWVVLAMAARPAWATVAAAAVVLGGWAAAARLPRSALPRVPLWFVLATLASGSLVTLGAGIEGLTRWALFTAIAVLSLFGALLLIWTTPLADIPPLLQRLARLARWTRLPVTEWSAAVSLGLRLLPILRAECLTAVHTAAQRTPPVRDRKRRWADRRRQASRAVLLCCATALRRAAEMGQAITARGGLGSGLVAKVDRMPTRRDFVVLAATLAILVAGCLI
jgi:energy-coupling factor transporter ATP-binding protein EcfA2